MTKTAIRHLLPGDVYAFDAMPTRFLYLHLGWEHSLRLGRLERYRAYRPSQIAPSWSELRCDANDCEFVFVVAHGKDTSWEPPAP